jgi:hypothetical protein
MKNLIKKPEKVSIVKFCLENFCTKEFKDNLKVVKRFENEDYMIVDTVDTVDFFKLILFKISFLIFYLNFLFFIYMSLQRL